MSSQDLPPINLSKHGVPNINCIYKAKVNVAVKDPTTKRLICMNKNDLFFAFKIDHQTLKKFDTEISFSTVYAIYKDTIVSIDSLDILYFCDEIKC